MAMALKGEEEQGSFRASENEEVGDEGEMIPMWRALLYQWNDIDSESKKQLRNLCLSVVLFGCAIAAIRWIKDRDAIQPAVLPPTLASELQKMGGLDAKHAFQ